MRFGYPNERRITQHDAFSGATRRAGPIFSAHGVISRSCGITTLRFFCLVGRKNGLRQRLTGKINRPYGTITLTRKHKNENRQLGISISNTDRALLEYVLRTVGVGKITSKRTTQSQHTPSYAYAIYNRQALSLLEQIQPYLKTYKAERGRLILRDYLKLTPRNGKYSLEQQQARHAFETAVLAITPASHKGLHPASESVSD